MTLIKNIETKSKLSLLASIIFVLGAVIIAIGSLYYVHKSNQEGKKNIYVLDNGVPLLLQRTSIKENRLVEFESHINTYHHLFFTIPPDDSFIKANMKKAMYLVDESGLKEYNNLREKGFYNQILASSSQLSILTDSITINQKKNFFIYYGKQRIDRKSSVIIRSIKTQGYIKDYSIRTQHNPHGALIHGWSTIENTDLSVKQKNAF